MDVKTLCLGLLTFGAASGYDLKKRFEQSFRHFYSAGYGSIYPALAYLADTELVTCEEIVQDGRPDRKLYRITAAGRAEFAKALDNTNPGHKMRSEFMAMMFFAHLMTPAQLKALLEHRTEELTAVLEEMAAEPSDTAHQEPGVEFVRGFGETVARAALEYIVKYRRLLDEQDPERLAS